MILLYSLKHTGDPPSHYSPDVKFIYTPPPPTFHTQLECSGRRTVTHDSDWTWPIERLSGAECESVKGRRARFFYSWTIITTHPPHQSENRNFRASLCVHFFQCWSKLIRLQKTVYVHNTMGILVISVPLTIAWLLVANKLVWKTDMKNCSSSGMFKH